MRVGFRPGGCAGLAVLACLAMPPAPLQAQGVPPDAEWRTFRTPHFRVSYPAELEPLARHAADRAEHAYETLERELTRPPRQRPIELVLSDNVDFSNAFATPFYSNRITVFAKPPVDHAALAFHTDWLDMVIIHELVHIFHLERSGLFGRMVRAIFGRVPAPWPIFPVVGTPTWSTEGLATYLESRFTGAGRVHGSFHDMVLRTAALEQRFDPIDRVYAGYSPIWPGGMRPYVYGSMFTDWLAERHGDEAMSRMVDRTAGSIVPTWGYFDWVGYRALGATFTTEYRAFRTELAQRYLDLADSLRALGLTQSERMTERGYFTMYPRLSPDGERLAYVASDGRTPVGTRVLELGTGVDRRVERRNQDGLQLTGAAWLPDGRGLIYSQWDFRGPYRIYEDLYTLIDGRRTRLTRGARLTEPDVARDGRVVAVRVGGGTNQLVIVDTRSGTIRPITEPAHDRYWHAPRWSPDGTRIAVSRWQAPGDYDVVVLDADGNLLHEATRDYAIDAAPSWSPDGRWVVFSSDRSGISNLYAFDVQAARAGASGDAALRQITNVLTGAFHPEVSPDGRWIYFSEYDSYGFDIARIPFDPGAWRDPAPLRPHPAAYGEQAPGHTPLDHAGREPRAGTTLSAGAGGDTLATTGGPARNYAAWPSVRPFFWLPLAWRDPVLGPAFGISSAGQDVIGRHSWNAGAALFPQRDADRAVDAFMGYANRSLGNPTITVELGRSWTGDSLVVAPDQTAGLLTREDRARLGVSFLHRRWRSSSRFGFAVERIWQESELRGTTAQLVDPRDDLFGVTGTVSYFRGWSQAKSISTEDALLVQLGARRRWDLDPLEREGQPTIDRGYEELSTWNAAYLGLDLPGFARHVLAARGSGILRRGERSPTSSVGGVFGTALDAGLLGELGAGPLFFPVRGFVSGERAGNRAWTASAEYRFPLLLLSRGSGALPIFLDGVSGALFTDAGDAWCEAGHLSPRCSDRALDPLLSAGGELGLDLGLFYLPPLRTRIGFAFPIRPQVRPSGYLAFGASF